MGQVAKDSVRTSRKALSCGSVIARIWTGPHNYGDCRKVGDPLWGKPVSATGVLARRAAENRVHEGGTFCFVGAF
jgi:predicted transcriptional regulator